MKRVIGLLLFVLAFAGCADADSALKQSAVFRTKLLASEKCSFDAEITADYGDKVQMFSVSCRTDSAGIFAFTVTAPDTIAGISGTVSEDGGRLTFEDTALCFDLMADDQLSPVSAPWIFLKTLRSGYITSACTEEELLRVTIDDSFDEDALQLDIWIDPRNGPVRAEILHENRRILTLKVSNFTIQ